ncbi:hypothetical protein HD806DRAFT_132774 [Xylariaceae sp. AK1471]|nr:hypothetical protein HD806DRAFT_132774 [Xylariaceae sp. AK1471]
MMFFQVLTILVVTILGSVSAQDTPPSTCATGCVNGVFVNAANIGCANGDTLCVCSKVESFHDGIRDCISAACPADVPEQQIPLADAYGDSICASASSTAISMTSTATITDAAPITTTTPIVSTTTPSSSAESSSQSTSVSTAEASTRTSAPSHVSLPTTSLAIPGSSSPTMPGMSHPTASISSVSNTGLSTAVKAGIGAGVGVAGLAAIIITVCACLRRRQRNKAASRARTLKISEPMAGSGRQFSHDVHKAEAGLPKPIVTTKPVHTGAAAQPTSPTSMYSYSSELEAHARRYEDLLPRTQPRTMI